MRFRLAVIGRALALCRTGLPQVEYDEHEIVRTVPLTKDYISFKGRRWLVRSICGERVAIRPLITEGQYGVFFGAFEIGNIDLT